MTTYVFDFYNLYIPKGNKYINKILGIKIFPLKLAEDFEKNRTSLFNKYRYGGWKTARCHIKSNSEEEAKQIATWLEFIYSFAQNRNVFFLRWYKYKQGSKHYFSTTKFIRHRENRFPDLIDCTLQNGRYILLPIRVTSIEEALERGPFYDKDISLFIDTSLETLRNSNKSKQGDIIGTIDGYIISNSDIVLELRFLISWISIEKLAKSHYNAYYKSKNKGLFEKDDIERIKKALQETLESIISDHERIGFMKRSISRAFLYEHDTRQKVSFYLDSLDLGFNSTELNELLEGLNDVRNDLVHDLDSNLLKKNRHYYSQLNKILEQIILRLLGINKSLEKEFLIKQFEKPTKV